jgi:hypothetical protein
MFYEYWSRSELCSVEKKRRSETVQPWREQASQLGGSLGKLYAEYASATKWMRQRQQSRRMLLIQQEGFSYESISAYVPDLQRASISRHILEPFDDYVFNASITRSQD